jgi:isochorismate pyruvate lyase
MNERVKPADCTDMAQVRYGIDRLDEQIVALLAERFRYMDAAARIKPERGDVRDEARKAEVIGHVQRIAAGRGARRKPLPTSTSGWWKIRSPMNSTGSTPFAISGPYRCRGLVSARSIPRSAWISRFDQPALDRIVRIVSRVTVTRSGGK